jgi:hypothetical protein
MTAQWVRTYRPDPRRFDERPAVLNGGFITDDVADLEHFTATALTKRGNVVIQRLGGTTDTERRALEAKHAEERW